MFRCFLLRLFSSFDSRARNRVLWPLGELYWYFCLLTPPFSDRGLAFTCKALQNMQSDTSSELHVCFKRSYDEVLRHHHNFVIRGLVTVRIFPPYLRRTPPPSYISIPCVGLEALGSVCLAGGPCSVPCFRDRPICAIFALIARSSQNAHRLLPMSLELAISLFRSATRRQTTHIDYLPFRFLLLLRIWYSAFTPTCSCNHPHHNGDSPRRNASLSIPPPPHDAAVSLFVFCTSL